MYLFVNRIEQSAWHRLNKLDHIQFLTTARAKGIMTTKSRKKKQQILISDKM